MTPLGGIQVETLPETVPLEAEKVSWKLCLYDDRLAANFYPLTLTRPMAELRVGLLTFAQRIARQLLHRVNLYWTAPHLRGYRNWDEEPIPSNDLWVLGRGATLFLTSRQILPRDFTFLPEQYPDGALLLTDGEVSGFFLARIPEAELPAGLFEEPVPHAVERWAGQPLPRVELRSRLYRYPWELIQENGVELTRDFHWAKGEGEILGEVHPSAIILEPEAVFVGEGARLDAGVIVDARGGPVWVESGAHLGPFTLVEGPVAVGRHSQLLGAKVRAGTSLGPVSRVGGEVEGTIVLGYTNKAHEGFLGHSYVGAWVNLGANTTTSDLKNNYRPVRVPWGGEERETGLLKLGCFLGDHLKTGIGTLINSGSVWGVGSNLWSEGGFLPKLIPSFSWGSQHRLVEYDLERFLGTARVVMERRGITLGTSEVEILQAVFELTRAERERLSVRPGTMT